MTRLKRGRRGGDQPSKETEFLRQRLPGGRLIHTGVAAALMQALRELDQAIDNLAHAARPDRIQEVLDRVADGSAFPDIEVVRESRDQLGVLQRKLEEILRAAQKGGGR
jgi:hypothetical protein